MKERPGATLRDEVGPRVEIEYTIVDRESLALRPIADLVLGAEGRLELGAIACSVTRVPHALVLSTKDPIDSPTGAAGDFQAAVRELGSRLEPERAMLLPGGLHPFSDGFESARSTRVSLPFRDGAELDRLRAAARAVRPLLPALAASSPIAEGQATGFLDSRIEGTRVGTEDVSSSSDAIEIGVLDVAECPAADLAIAEALIAVVQALYHEELSSYADQCRLATPPLANLLRDVSRAGERAIVPDAALLRVLGFAGLASDEPRASDVWRHLIDATLGDTAAHLLTRARLDVILREGPLARRILASGETRATYAKLALCLTEGRMLRVPSLSPSPPAASSGSARA